MNGHRDDQTRYSAWLVFWCLVSGALIILAAIFL